MLNLTNNTTQALKKKAITLPVFCFMALLLMSSNFAVDIFKEIENAFNIGNSKLVEGYLNSSIELETPTSKGIYSRSQAQIIIDKFFQKYPPRSFSIQHIGNASGGSRFAVGNYASHNEHVFRVTIHIKKFGSEYLIQVIKIE